MRRVRCLILIAIMICSIHAVSAISTTIKDSYAQGETIIAEISGDILEPISSSNVEFRRGHILVPFDFELSKIGEKYYLWAITPESEMNYSIVIKDITTFVLGKIQRIDYQKNFSVSGNLSDYSVKPGFISTGKDFEIEVRLNEDSEKKINIEFLGEKEIILKPGLNILKFYIYNVNKTGFYNLTIGKYVLPTYIKVNETGERHFYEPSLNLTNLTIGIENRTLEEEEMINKERVKYHCYEFPGKICTAEEVCSGQSIVSMDGPCCVNGECKKREGEAGGGGAWIGYLIVAIVIIAGIFIWIRYKKIKAEENPIPQRIISIEKKIP
ncbi:MAG: hypothetical protein QXS38_01960 [Candidatus Pacearchaeota archaeon]